MLAYHWQSWRSERNAIIRQVCLMLAQLAFLVFLIEISDASDPWLLILL